MRFFSHDELHRIVDAVPALKQRSDVLHELPPPTGWGEWAERKREMCTVWAEAIGCHNPASAAQMLATVAGIFKTKAASPAQLKESAHYKELLEMAHEVERNMETQNLCHVPGGGNYKCFCDG